MAGSVKPEKIPEPLKRLCEKWRVPYQRILETGKPLAAAAVSGMDFLKIINILKFFYAAAASF
jgi:hypothetical protein